jgi:hypothetical protein
MGKRPISVRATRRLFSAVSLSMSASRVPARSIARRRCARWLIVAILLLTGAARAQETIDFLEPRTFPIGGMPDDLLVVDFDGDGELDLLTTNFDFATISVLLGDGTGDFVPLDDQSASSAPSQVATADFNTTSTSISRSRRARATGSTSCSATATAPSRRRSGASATTTPPAW